MKNPVKVKILHSLSRSQKGHQVAAMIRSFPIIWLLHSLAKGTHSGPRRWKKFSKLPKAATNLISSNCLASELWFHKLLLSWCHCLSARSTLVSALRETQAKTMTKPDICQVWGTTALFRPVKGAQNSQKWPKFSVFDANRGTGLKKSTSPPIVANMSYD